MSETSASVSPHDEEKGHPPFSPQLCRGSSTRPRFMTKWVGKFLYGAEKDPSKPSYDGWAKSGKMALKASWLNLFIIVIPFAWASHWLVDVWGHEVTFLLCFIAIIPLQNIFDICGDFVARRKDREFGDFLAITLKNLVEATLAAILLKNCHLRLLQSTIAGVVILHLLLVPGTAFFVRGSQVFQQILHPHHASLNPSLLMTGVLAIMLPTAFFAALDRGASADGSRDAFVSDTMRDSLLKMSRGVSVMLLLIYVASRIYRHNPPSFQRPKEPSVPATGLPATEAPSSAPANELSVRGARPGLLPRGSASRNSGGLGLAGKREDDSEEGLLHPIVCATLICVSTAIMGVTAEFLVQSIDPIRERFNIQAEWFGLILLPLVSFAPEAVVVAWYFAAPWLRRFKFVALGCKTRADDSKHDKKSHAPSLLAHGRPIDLSIQFTLWWMPLLVLFAWWTGKPFHLLFDYFEVALLLGSCFLVNYVTADGKTNFAEGVTLITFYAMIATATWFYPGQPQVGFLLSCPGSVAEAAASGVGNALAVSS